MTFSEDHPAVAFFSINYCDFNHLMNWVRTRVRSPYVQRFLTTGTSFRANLKRFTTFLSCKRSWIVGMICAKTRKLGCSTSANKRGEYRRPERFVPHQLCHSFIHHGYHL